MKIEILKEKWLDKIERVIQIGEEKDTPLEPLTELGHFLSTEWLSVVSKNIQHPWYGLEHFKIPSPIIRVDLAPGKSLLQENIYEVEVRPAGLGITLLLSTTEQKYLWQKALKDCRGFITFPSSPIFDDEVCARILGLPYFEDTKKQEGYWVRAENMSPAEALELENISLVPIREDGNKQYLIDLGLAKAINHESELDFGSNFVIKPIRGKWSKDVEIYLAEKKDFRGFSTRTKICKVLKSEKKFMIQNFIPPERELLNGATGFIIWRCFYGWIDSRYQYIGGLWMWRNVLKVHGASDAVCGLLVGKR